jgi:spore coat protein U-like protein
MKINKKSIFLRRGLFLIFVTASGYSYAECELINNQIVQLPNIPSITLYEKGQGETQFSAGLKCSGLGIGNITHIKYRVNQQPSFLVKNSTGEKIPINIVDINRTATVVGQEINLSEFSILNFFTGPDESLPFYISIPVGQMVSPGTYISEKNFNIKWFYSVPGFAVAGIGEFYESPGFVRGFLGSVRSWGTGRDSSLGMQITILPDCRISTSNVNFGTAAFAGAFEPVKTSMGIKCSAKTPYHVSLNNGLNPQNGSQRAMKSTTGNNYLKYEIYKNATSERWGSGNQRWSSANATLNPGVYDGLLQQGYSFTTRILPDNSNSLPAGIYNDTITVQVEF